MGSRGYRVSLGHGMVKDYQEGEKHKWALQPSGRQAVDCLLQPQPRAVS